jgi:hypothetical protein
MISLHLLDEQQQVVESYSSATLSDLLVANGLTPAQIFPQPNLITQDWQADSLVASLQSVSERLTPRAIISDGAMVQKPLLSLSDAEKATIARQLHRDFTMNGEAYVEFLSSVVTPAEAAPVGLDELNALLDMLKRARNQGLALETIELS